MVKILLDPSMYHPTHTVEEELQKAADLGYEYLELSPRADFHEWHHHPKVDDAMIRSVRKAMETTGVKIWSLNPVYNWASPDEDERRHHVKNFRRTIEIAAELEIPLIATEFSGDPNQPVRSENQFYRSIEELIPDFEAAGLECTVEAHPYDFVETNSRAIQVVRGVNEPWFNYEYCLPHMFHLGEGSVDVRSQLAYAGERLRHVHVADGYNHVVNVGNRYIVNPPGADARIHQHNEIGNGEVPWAYVFGYLRETDYDGPLSVCVFGWEEEADAIHIRMRERLEAEFAPS